MSLTPSFAVKSQKHWQTTTNHLCHKDPAGPQEVIWEGGGGREGGLGHEVAEDQWLVRVVVVQEKEECLGGDTGRSVVVAAA